tara:strand:- start:1127 stop:2443 length:1317 start_codon:yes stop_codon:yes gene_type:complete
LNNDARNLSLQILKYFDVSKKQLSIIQNDFFLSGNYTYGAKSRAKVLTNEIIRYKGRIDYLIEEISGRKNKNFNKNLISILRIAFYEILYEKSIPDYAAVNTAVELTKKKINRKAAGLCNAVLRNLIRRKEEKENWDKEFKKNIKWNSLPIWLQQRWSKSYKKDTFKKLVNSFNESPKIFVRNNTKLRIEALKEKLFSDGVDSNIFDNSFLKIKKGSKSIIENNLFKSGQISIQDPSSYGIIECLDPKNEDIILDVCAAPGTKSLALSYLVGKKGKVYSSDINKSRIDLGLKDLKRHNRKNIFWSVKDASKDIFPSADKILIDAPCSGTGVLRRKPDIRWRREEKEIEVFSKLQLKILCNMSDFLNIGGTIVYATCSIDIAENYNVVQQFLKIKKNFKIIDLPQKINRDLIDINKCFSTFSEIDKIDGMFAARIKKYG